MVEQNPHAPRLPTFKPHHTDPVGEALHQLRLTGTFYCQAELSAPWGIDIPSFDGVMTFVVVTGGRCWLEVEGSDPHILEQGSLALISRGAKHRLRSAPDAETVPLDALSVEKISPLYETVQHGGGGEITNALYGIVRFDHAAGQLLMSLLPHVLRIDTWNDRCDGWLQSTLQFISREAQVLRPGGETVITRLADILVIQAVRTWINTHSHGAEGWLSALRDKQIGQAIMAIHRAPAEDWTVTSLAHVAGMSRSAFSERFTKLVGQPAMKYLVRWRMQLALGQLRETSQPISAIAISLGYNSEAAFCRAFKRVFDMTPGIARAK